LTIPKFSPNRVRPDEAPELVASRNFESLAGILSLIGDTIDEHTTALASITKKLVQLAYPSFQGFNLRSGSNSRIGSAVLVAGTVTVANTSITAATLIFLNRSTTGGTAGHLSYTTIPGTSFTINSSNAADTSTVNYLLIGTF
jgi:hypothetical protein